MPETFDFYDDRVEAVGSAVCRICGRALTNPISVKEEIGPICSGRGYAHGSGKGKRKGRVKMVAQEEKLFDEEEKPVVIDPLAASVKLFRNGLGGTDASVPHYCKGKSYCHSETGHEWGYAGSGPADLAYCILYYYTLNHAWSYRYHQFFKEEFLVGMPEAGGTIPREAIVAFIEKMKQVKF
jgi:hypothetical protein